MTNKTLKDLTHQVSEEKGALRYQLDDHFKQVKKAYKHLNNFKKNQLEIYREWLGGVI